MTLREMLLDEAEAEDVWEQYSELVETIRCDQRSEESLLGKREFYAALKEFVARTES